MKKETRKMLFSATLCLAVSAMNFCFANPGNAPRNAVRHSQDTTTTTTTTNSRDHVRQPEPFFDFLFKETDHILSNNRVPLRNKDVCSYAIILHSLRKFCAGELRLIDGIVGYDQCHINALLVGKFHEDSEIKNKLLELLNLYPEDFQNVLSEGLRSERREFFIKLQKIIKFITLNMFLSSSNFNNRPNLANKIERSRSYFSIIDKRSIDFVATPLVPFDLEKLREFCSSGANILRAKRALGKIVFDFIGDLILELKNSAFSLPPFRGRDSRALLDELWRLWNSDIIGKTPQGVPVYMKAAGFFLFQMHVMVFRVPFYMKIKFISPDGVRFFTYGLSNYEDRLLFPNVKSAIVLDAYSSATRTDEEVNEAKETCYYHLLHRRSDSVQHDKEESCWLCRRSSDYEDPFFKRQEASFRNSFGFKESDCIYRGV